MRPEPVALTRGTTGMLVSDEPGEEGGDGRPALLLLGPGHGVLHVGHEGVGGEPERLGQHPGVVSGHEQGAAEGSHGGCQVYHARFDTPRKGVVTYRSMTVPRIEIIGVTGLPEIGPGARLGELVAGACRAQGTPLQAGDIAVVTQKAVSKAEGRLVDLADVSPSPFALEFARRSGKDPRVVEVVLGESRSIVRSDPERGILITETHHGFICANAGVDSSNVPGEDMVSLLPEDPDRSARVIREQILDATGVDTARDHHGHVRAAVEGGPGELRGRGVRDGGLQGLPRGGRRLGQGDGP